MVVSLKNITYSLFSYQMSHKDSAFSSSPLFIRACRLKTAFDKKDGISAQLRELFSLESTDIH